MSHEVSFFNTGLLCGGVVQRGSKVRERRKKAYDLQDCEGRGYSVGSSWLFGTKDCMHTISETK